MAVHLPNFDSKATTCHKHGQLCIGERPGVTLLTRYCSEKCIVIHVLYISNETTFYVITILHSPRDVTGTFNQFHHIITAIKIMQFTQ